MKKLKHSKYKNTGILFEMLVRKLTAETLSSDKSVTVDIIKKYFGKNTELSKELQLYNSLLKERFKTEARAYEYIRTVKSAYDKLNKDALMKEKLEAHQKYLWDRSAREEDARKEGIEQTKLLIARSLLENGIQDELILKNCNITLDQLNELRLSDKKN
jgi:predicted transposase/invertase (TIGR01784 family)